MNTSKSTKLIAFILQIIMYKAIALNLDKFEIIALVIGDFVLYYGLKYLNSDLKGLTLYHSLFIDIVSFISKYLPHNMIKEDIQGFFQTNSKFSRIYPDYLTESYPFFLKPLAKRIIRRERLYHMLSKDKDEDGDTFFYRKETLM